MKKLLKLGLVTVLTSIMMLSLTGCDVNKTKTNNENKPLQGKKEKMINNVAIVVSNDNFNNNPYETIDAIKKSGFKNVFIQWYNKDWEPSQEQQLKYIKEKGLNVIFAHLGYKNINNIWLDDESGDIELEKYKNDIRIMHENGINLVVMHLTTHKQAPIYSEYGIKRLKDLIEYAKSYGVKIAFENTQIKGYQEYVLSNIDNDNYGICLDAGHLHAHFNDEMNFELLKNKILALHLHDNHQNEDEHLIPFDGTIDWEKMILELKNANYTGPITLETVYSDYYKNISIEEFYKRCFETAIKLSNMLNN